MTSGEIQFFNSLIQLIMNIVKRAMAPTPPFFKQLRMIGLILLAVSGSVMASPMVLPAALVTAAGYLAVAGGVISAVSQVTVDGKSLAENEAKKQHKNGS